MELILEAIELMGFWLIILFGLYRVAKRFGFDPFKGALDELLSPPKKAKQLHGIDVIARALSVDADGRPSLVRSRNQDVTVVTEYTITMPVWMIPLNLIDGESAFLYSIDTAYGHPQTGDDAFDGNFAFLRPPGPEAQALVNIPELRHMFNEISQNIGCVRLDNGKLIFRDKGSTAPVEVEITAELIAGMVLAIPAPTPSQFALDFDAPMQAQVPKSEVAEERETVTVQQPVVAERDDLW